MEEKQNSEPNLPIDKKLVINDLWHFAQGFTLTYKIPRDENINPDWFLRTRDITRIKANLIRLFITSSQEQKVAQSLINEVINVLAFFIPKEYEFEIPYHSNTVEMRLEKIKNVFAIDSAETDNPYYLALLRLFAKMLEDNLTKVRERLKNDIAQAKIRAEATRASCSSEVASINNSSAKPYSMQTDSHQLYGAKSNESEHTGVTTNQDGLSMLASLAPDYSPHFFVKLFPKPQSSVWLVEKQSCRIQWNYRYPIHNNGRSSASSVVVQPQVSNVLQTEEKVSLTSSRKKRQSLPHTDPKPHDSNPKPKKVCREPKWGSAISFGPKALDADLTHIAIRSPEMLDHMMALGVEYVLATEEFFTRVENSIVMTYLPDIGQYGIITNCEWRVNQLPEYSECDFAYGVGPYEGEEVSKKQHREMRDTSNFFGFHSDDNFTAGIDGKSRRSWPQAANHSPTNNCLLPLLDRSQGKPRIVFHFNPEAPVCKQFKCVDNTIVVPAGTLLLIDYGEGYVFENSAMKFLGLRDMDLTPEGFLNKYAEYYLGPMLLEPAFYKAMKIESVSLRIPNSGQIIDSEFANPDIPLLALNSDNRLCEAPLQEKITPLMVACYLGKVDYVKALLRLGAYPMAQCLNTGLTALHVVIRSPITIENKRLIINALTQNSSTLTILAANKISPLMSAIEYYGEHRDEGLDLIAMLLKKLQKNRMIHDALKKYNSDDFNSLLLAIQLGDLPLVQLILDTWIKNKPKTEKSNFYSFAEIDVKKSQLLFEALSRSKEARAIIEKLIDVSSTHDERAIGQLGLEFKEKLQVLREGIATRSSTAAMGHRPLASKPAATQSKPLTEETGTIFPGRTRGDNKFFPEKQLEKPLTINSEKKKEALRGKRWS